MRTTRRGSEGLRGEILKAVTPFLKRHGAGIASVDKIMKAAGFTSGALYSQFKNKEDLCTQAICAGLDAMLKAYGTAIPKGCTFVALGSDMAKGSARAKQAYETRIQALFQLFAGALGAGPEALRRAKVQRILSTMLGALTLARAMNDAGAANELLSQVRNDVLRQLDEEEERT